MYYRWPDLPSNNCILRGNSCFSSLRHKLFCLDVLWCRDDCQTALLQCDRLDNMGEKGRPQDTLRAKRGEKAGKRGRGQRVGTEGEKGVQEGKKARRVISLNEPHDCSRHWSTLPGHVAAVLHLSTIVSGRLSCSSYISLHTAWWLGLSVIRSWWYGRGHFFQCGYLISKCTSELVC